MMLGYRSFSSKFRSQGRLDMVLFWKDVAAKVSLPFARVTPAYVSRFGKAPHHSRASWMKFYRRHKHELYPADVEVPDPPPPPPKKLPYFREDDIRIARYFMNRPAGTAEEVYQEFVAFRRSIDMDIIPLTGGEDPFGALVRVTRAGGRVVALASDRDLTRNGVEVDLLGHRARMAKGPAQVEPAVGNHLVGERRQHIDGLEQRGFHIARGSGGMDGKEQRGRPGNIRTGKGGSIADDISIGGRPTGHWDADSRSCEVHIRTTVIGKRG